MKVLKVIFGIAAILSFIGGLYVLGLLPGTWNIIWGYALIILGEILIVLISTIDGIVNRIRFFNEEKEYKANNPFKAIDNYNHSTKATFTDKMMFINHEYDRQFYKLEGNGTTERGNVLYQNDTIKLVSKKNDEKIKVKSIENKQAQELGRRRQFLEREKIKVNLLDEFGKQIILVAFIKFAYDSASVQFADDKKTIATLSVIVTIVTYFIYFLFIRGFQKPNDIYYLSEYEIKKIDKLLEDVDTPDNWKEKRRQQMAN